MAARASWLLVRPAQERPFVVGGDVIVGRSKESGLRISEGFVSRRHARLWLDGNRLLVEDLGSANGTFVNGERIIARTELEPGDRVCFDETEFHIEYRGERSGADPDATVYRSRDDDDPASGIPGRPSPWGGSSTRVAGSARDAKALGDSGPTHKRRAEALPSGTDADFELEVGAAPAGSAPGVSASAAPAAETPASRPPATDAPLSSAPASRPSRAATINEPDFELGLTGESRPARAPQPASVSLPDFDTLDLSLGDARPEEPEPKPSLAVANATVIMGEDAPGRAALTPGPENAMGVLGLAGPVEGNLYALAKGQISIGRAPECDIMIEESSVSKRHAELVIQPGNYRIRDLSRGNGVFVNGSRTDDAALAPGDVIRLGRVEFVFDDYGRLLEGGGDVSSVPAWVWTLAGFVGAGAVMAIGALFVL